MTLVARSLRRQLTTAMAMAMALALLLSGTALAQTSADAVAAVAIDDSCNDVPEDNFDDVPESYEFDDEIECLKAYDITKGVGDGSNYAPQKFVPRWQMALFIYRLAQIAEEQLDDVTLPTPDGDTQFNDLGDLEDQEAINAIDALNEMGVVEGVTSTTYEPFTNIKRDQMASFLNRLQDYLAGESDEVDSFADGEDAFPDDEGNVHEGNINSLANVGIVQGKATGDYDPRGNVTRGQMSAFIMRYFEVNVDNGAFESEYPGEDPAPASNQALDVSPTAAEVAEVSADGTKNTGARTYTVSGLDDTKTYDIELHEAEDVVIDGATVTFKNNTPIAANTGVSIETVNGAAVDVAETGSGTAEVNNTAPVNGTITFTVDSVVADRVIPVVNADADGDNSLDLETGATATTPKAPTEDFGIGGEREFIPAEATAGQVNTADTTITRVNKDENYVLVDTDADATPDVTLYYDANDNFRLAATATAADEASICNPVSLTTWEANLSTGDQLDQSSIYASDDEASSTLCIEDLSPGAVTGVSADAVDEDTITVTWAAPGTTPDSFNIYRKNGAETATLTDYTKVGEVSGSTLTFTDNGLNASTQYAYAVTQVIDGDESPINPGAADDATTTAAGATANPQSTDAYIQTDATFPGEISEGDVVRIVFSKQMGPVVDGDLVRVRDAEGEILNVVCEAVPDSTNAEEADCVFNSADVTIAGTTYGAGRVLTATFDAAEGATDDLTADNSVTGGNDRLDYPVTIVTQNGFADLGGRAWTPSDDSDNVIDDEGAKTSAGFTADTTAPTLASASGSGTSATLTYSEAIDVIGAAANVVVREDSIATDCSGVAVATGTAIGDDDGDTIETVTLTAGLTATTAYEVAVAASHVEDFAGNDNAVQCVEFTAS